MEIEELDQSPNKQKKQNNMTDYVASNTNRPKKSNRAGTQKRNTNQQSQVIPSDDNLQSSQNVLEGNNNEEEKKIRESTFSLQSGYNVNECKSPGEGKSPIKLGPRMSMDQKQEALRASLDLTQSVTGSVRFQPKLSQNSLRKMSTQVLQKILDCNVYSEYTKSTDSSRLIWLIIPFVLGSAFMSVELYYMQTVDYMWVANTCNAWFECSSEEMTCYYFMYEFVWNYFSVFFCTIIPEFFMKPTDQQKRSAIIVIMIVFPFIMLFCLSIMITIYWTTIHCFAIIFLFILSASCYVVKKNPEKSKLVKIVCVQIVIMLIFQMILVMMGVTKSKNPGFPLGTIFPVFQVTVQNMLKSLLFQGLQHNLMVINVVWFCTFGIKIIGLTLNFSDLLAASGIMTIPYFIMFIANQFYLVSGYHYILHPSMAVLRKIMSMKFMRTSGKFIREKVVKILDGMGRQKIKNMFAACIDVEPVYELDEKTMIDVNNTFKKQNGFLQILTLFTFGCRLTVFMMFKTSHYHYPKANVNVDEQWPRICQVFITVGVLIIGTVIVNHWKKLDLFVYWDCTCTVFEKTLIIVLIWWCMDNFGLKYILDDSNNPDFNNQSFKCIGEDGEDMYAYY